MLHTGFAELRPTWIYAGLSSNANCNPASSSYLQIANLMTCTCRATPDVDLTKNPKDIAKSAKNALPDVSAVPTRDQIIAKVLHVLYNCTCTLSGLVFIATCDTTAGPQLAACSWYF